MNREVSLVHIDLEEFQLPLGSKSLQHLIGGLIDIKDFVHLLPSAFLDILHLELHLWLDVPGVIRLIDQLHTWRAQLLIIELELAIGFFILIVILVHHQVQDVVSSGIAFRGEPAGVADLHATLSVVMDDPPTLQSWPCQKERSCSWNH